MREIEQTDLTAIYDNLAHAALSSRTGGPIDPQAFMCSLSSTPGLIGNVIPMPDTVLNVAFSSPEMKGALNRMVVPMITRGTAKNTLAEAIFGFNPRIAAFVYEAITKETEKGGSEIHKQEVLIELITEEQAYLGRCPVINGKAEYRPLDFLTVSRWNTVH